MKKARNLLINPKEYKGKETYCYDEYCPCRPCWHPHDCGWWEHNNWKETFHCLTNYRFGCPDPLPRPCHIFRASKRFDRRKPGDKFRCLQCGQLIELGRGDCDWITTKENK